MAESSNVDVPVEELKEEVEESASSLAARIYATADEALQGFGSPAPPAATPAKSGLDFKSGGDADPVTPPVVPKAVFAGEEVDYNAFVMDTLMWKAPVRSALYLLTGIAAICAISMLAHHDIPILTVICYVTLAQMALNFLRLSVDPETKISWMDSNWTGSLINNLGDGVKAAASVHDKHLSAADPTKHLLIVLSIWAVSLVCRLLSPFTLAMVLYIGAFAVPKVYTMFKAKIDPVFANIKEQATAKITPIDYRAKAAVVMVIIMLFGLISKFDLVIAVFVCCVYASAALPKEVQKVHQTVGPMVTPVGKKVGMLSEKVSDLLVGQANKFELTPTPLKSKKIE